MKTVKQISEFCKIYRMHVLKISVPEICKDTDYKEANVYSFESGKANKIDYLLLYYNACRTEKERTGFVKGVFENTSLF